MNQKSLFIMNCHWSLCVCNLFVCVCMCEWKLALWGLKISDSQFKAFVVGSETSVLLPWSPEDEYTLTCDFLQNCAADVDCCEATRILPVVSEFVKFTA